METRAMLHWARGRIARATIALGAAGLLVLGLVLVGHWARDQLRYSGRYAFNLSEIDCEPPPGETRAEFLGEVQYLAGLPDRVNLLDNDLRQRLRDAFARHPWVKQVESVEMAPSRVEMRLQYRKPVLAVLVSGKMRAVDADGILLPISASAAGLTVFEGTAAPPAGPAGTRWGDPTVEAAARKAAAEVK